MRVADHSAFAVILFQVSMSYWGQKTFLEDLNCRGQRVLTRVDFNVPLDTQQRVTDNNRIVQALPTIRRIVEQGGRAVLMSHLGRPGGARVPELSLKPAAEALSRLLEAPVTLAPDCIGPEVEVQVQAMQDGEVVLLENLRYHKAETKNDPELCRQLARLGELYVNDAFGTAHRAHASTAGVVEFLPNAAVGYLIRQELDFLGGLMDAPARPYVAILGGAKIADKIKVIKNLMGRVQALVIGGGMANTFLAAQGHALGDSLVDAESLDVAAGLVEQARNRGVCLHLPTDGVIAQALKVGADIQVVAMQDGVPEGWRLLDIGPQTLAAYKDVVQNAKTVFWNGPMGVFETPPFDAGTVGIAQALAEATAGGAVTVVGGGDSAAAVQQSGLAGQISHISTGGGASLEFLEGRELPGVAVIPNRN